MNEVSSKVMFLRVSQIARAVTLTIAAQEFMPVGKKFGAIIWGQSGIGKNAMTDNLHQTLSKATGNKWDMIDCNVSASAPEDITGLPAIVNGLTIDNPRYRLPKDSYGIWRLDEMDRPVYRQNLVAMVKFCIDRTVETPLPINWFVLGLANGISDDDTQPLTEHIKGRFCHLYVSTNSAKAHEEMTTYMNGTGVEDSVKKLYALNPLQTRDEFEELAVYNHRSLLYASAILKAYKKIKDSGADWSDVLLPVLSGVIGRNPACELLKLYELSDLATLDEVCRKPQSSPIPADLSLLHKYVTALVNESVSDCTKATKLLEYLVRLSDEVSRYAIEILATGCPQVCKSKVYVVWKNRIK